jgi:hypothetical protein
MSEDLDEPIAFTRKHERMLLSHDLKLNEHGRKLDEHGRKLDEHGRKLDEHGRKLDEHGHKLDGHTFDIPRLGILMEESRRDTKLILDVVLSTQKRLDRFDYLDEKVINHENRLAAVETFIRNDR